MWRTALPALDRPIVAIGFTAYDDKEGGCRSPFCAIIQWTKDASGYEGWHDLDGLVFNPYVDTSVYIDFWTDVPESKL